MRTSVLICTYNYARYLPQCLSSVLSQTHPPDEVIVIDDGSTDGTPDVMKRFPGVHYVYQNNTGKAVAFTRAVSLSTGDVICHLDADDYWQPHKLEQVVRCFEREPEIGGVIHEVSYVDAEGCAIRFPWELYECLRPTTLTLDECEDVGFLYPLPRARGRFFGVPNTCCIRRSLLQDLLPLPAEVGGSVDGVVVSAGLRNRMAYLPDALAVNRIHGKNAGFGNVAATQQTIFMWNFLLASPNFCARLSGRHIRLLHAKILERKAYLASRTGQEVLGGFWAGLQVPIRLAANGCLFNWKHLVLSFACLIPVKRTTIGQPRTASQLYAPKGPKLIPDRRPATNL